MTDKMKDLYYTMFYWCYEISFMQDDEDVRQWSALLAVTAWQFNVLLTVCVWFSVWLKYLPLINGYRSGFGEMVVLLCLNYYGYIYKRRAVMIVSEYRTHVSGPIWQQRLKGLCALFATVAIFAISVWMSRII